MHRLLCPADWTPHLVQELERSFPGTALQIVRPGRVETALSIEAVHPLPPLVFARQMLLAPQFVEFSSIRLGAERLAGYLMAVLPEGRPWQLHLEPDYGSGRAGQHRCQLLREGLDEQLKRTRRHVLRQRRPVAAPFTPEDSLVQVLLDTPDRGWISVAVAPLPYVHRRVISPFPLGEIQPTTDKTAPSRAFAKLVEAECRLGRRIAAGERCVDLGASPGSWTYVAAKRGATVTAVDRSPLRADLMSEPRVRFQAGDAFTFFPDKPVDWLLCDVIAAPERSMKLLLDWASARRMRHFVVTIKFRGDAEYPELDLLKQRLLPVCTEFFLSRLCANKNEACAFGTLR